MRRCSVAPPSSSRSAFAACGDGAGRRRRRAARAGPAGHRGARRHAAPRVEHAHCALRADGCAAVTGRVLYVEAVDPDGDGDAHYVLAGGDVTAPGPERDRRRPRRCARAACPTSVSW